MYDKAYKIILKRTKEDLKSILMDYKKANWKWEYSMNSVSKSCVTYLNSFPRQWKLNSKMGFPFP